MTDIRVAVEAVLHRQNDSVSIILHEIPMADLEKVLRDVGTKAWRTNVIDGIQAQYVAGESLGLSQTRRSFHAYADEEKS
jgi:hypothetical protein